MLSSLKIRNDAIVLHFAEIMTRTSRGKHFFIFSQCVTNVMMRCIYYLQGSNVTKYIYCMSVQFWRCFTFSAATRILYFLVHFSYFSDNSFLLLHVQGNRVSPDVHVAFLGLD